MARSMQWWDGNEVKDKRVREAGFDPDSPVIKRLTILVDQLLGFPRHLSQHVGGFLIADQPLTDIVPVENAAMEGRTVIQWDKDDLDDLGLLKVDVLALGMLTVIHRSFDLLRGWYGRELTMATVPAEDPLVYDMIGTADTVGVFQIESRAQMAMLPRLRPALLLRPGNRGCHYSPPGRFRVTWFIRIYGAAMVRIRSSIPARQSGGCWNVRSVCLSFRSRLCNWRSWPQASPQGRPMSCDVPWLPGNAAEDWVDSKSGSWMACGSAVIRHNSRNRSFNQMKGFGEYGFPESHAASFALLVYVSAWLKCHEPAIFACALLNSQPMGFYAPAQIIAAAKQQSVEVRPVDINYSAWDCTLERAISGEPVLRLGLCMVKGLSVSAGESIVAARGCTPFQSVAELSERAALTKTDYSALAAADALQDLAK